MEIHKDMSLLKLNLQISIFKQLIEDLEYKIEIAVIEKKEITGEQDVQKK